jgi:Tol biopolymer transport system component
VNPDGTGDTAIANGWNPAWSADGMRIASEAGYRTIYLANADGSRKTSIAATGFAQNPAWSPDGRIAYDSWHYDCSSGYDCYLSPDGIFVINADGTGDHRLATHGTEPAWSPDGTKIAFSDFDVNRSNSTSDIYVMNADGSGITDLTNDYYYFEESPSWSPDGSKIAFTRQDRFGLYQEVWMINAAGGGVARVAEGYGRQISDHDPAWSPDGTKIVFESDRPPSVIVTVDPSGANQTDIAFGRDPDWQPLVGPKRTDYKTASQFCKAERAFIGERQFRQKYATGPKSGANAHGKCVRRNR